MNRTLREWIVFPAMALGCLGGISELQAVVGEDEGKAFREADKAFVEGDFERGENLLNELIANHPGEFDLATQALRRICLSEYLELIDNDWPSQGYPNQMFNKAGKDHDEMWTLISEYLREGFLDTGKFGENGEKYSEDPRKRPFLLESLWRKVGDYPLTPKENMSDEAAERIITLQRSGYLEDDDPAVIDASILLVFIRKSQRRYYEATQLADALVAANNRQIDWLTARAVLHARIKSPRANFLLRELFSFFDKPGIDPVVARAAQRTTALRMAWTGFSRNLAAEGPGWLGQMVPDNENRAWDRVAAGLVHGSEKDIDLWLQSCLGKEQSKVYLMRRDETGSAKAWCVLDNQLKSLRPETLREFRDFQESRCRIDGRSRTIKDATQGEKLAFFRRFPWAITSQRALMNYAQGELEAGHGQAARRAFRDLLEHAEDPKLLKRAQVGFWLSVAQGKDYETLEKLIEEINPDERFPWMDQATSATEIRQRLMKGVPAQNSKEEDHALAGMGIQLLNLPARPLWPPMKYRSSPGLSFVNLQRVGTNLLVSTRNLLAWYEANNGANPVWADSARGGHGDHSISRMGEFRPIVEGNRIYTRWSYRADPLKLVAMNLKTREIIWSQNLADSPKAKRIISLGNPILSGGQIYFASAWDEHRPTGRFQLQLSCVDAATGQVIWREDLSVSANQLFFEGVFGESLTVHDGAIYCSPSTGFIGRFDARDGKMEWMYNYESVSRHALAADTKGNAPLIVGNLVISLPRDSNVMVGLDKQTGKLLWSSSLPLAVEIIGQVGQEILIQGRTALASINARNGKIKWHSPYPDKMVGKATLQGASIYIGSQTMVYRYDATTGIERETRSLPETTNSIQNIRVLHDKIYLITDEPVEEKENSLVRHSPGDSAWEVTAWDPKLYFPNGNESSGSEMLIHENDMLHCLEATPAGKVLWQRFVYPRPTEIFFVEGKVVLLYNKGRYDLYLKALDQKTGNMEWELTLLRLRAGHGATVGRSGNFLYGKDNSDRFYLVDLNIGEVVLQNRIPRRNGHVKAGFGGGKVHFLMTPAYQRSLYWLQWDIGSNEITGMNQVLQGRNGDPKQAFRDNWVESAKFGEHACYFVSRQEIPSREYVAYRTNYKDQSVHLVGRNTRHLKFEPPFIFLQQLENDQNRKNRTHPWAIQREDDPNYAHSLDLPHAWYHRPTFVNGHVLDVRSSRNKQPWTVRVHDLGSKKTLLEHTSENTERMGGIPAGPNRILVYDWKKNDRNTPPHFKFTLYDLNQGLAGPTMEIDYWSSNNQTPNEIRVTGSLVLINDRHSVKAWQLQGF